MNHAEQLVATAETRRYQMRPYGDRRFGKQALYLQNRFGGSWKLAAVDCSDRWYAILNMVKRGWAVLEN